MSRRSTRGLAAAPVSCALALLIATACGSYEPQQLDDGGAPPEWDAGIDSGDDDDDDDDDDTVDPDAAELEVDLTGNDFGEVVESQISATATFLITNRGASKSGLLARTIAGDGADFEIDDQGCDGQELDPDESCSIQVAFAPLTPGAHSATLEVAADPGGAVSMLLQGVALAQGELAINDANHDFGPVDVSDISDTTTVTVINNGLEPSGALTLAPTDPTRFVVSADTCTDAVLAAGASCTFDVHFAPDAVGPATASVTVSADPGGATAMSFGGTGSATVAVATIGSGAGLVTSAPSGISCDPVCDSPFTTPAVVLTAAPGAGSTFVGWGGPCSGTGDCDLELPLDEPVTARFEAPQALVVSKAGTGTGSVASSAPGISCGADCTESLPYGATVELSASADTGATFTGWSGDCTGTGVCTVTMDATRSVTATFAIDMHTVTVTRAGNGAGTVATGTPGIACGSDCVESYPYGAGVTLSATPATGSTFTGWSGACTGTGSCALSVTGPVQVTATFALTSHTLTVNKLGNGAGTVSSPDGISCGGDCSETVNYGTPVTLTAAALAGSTFTGWSGACTGTGNCVVTISGATTVAATFALQTHVVTVAKNGNGSGTITSQPDGIACGSDCDQAYDHGTFLTLSATPATGSVFSGWGGACSGTGSCTVTVNAAANVTATFTLTTNVLTVEKAGSGGGTVSASPGIACGADCTEPYPYGTTVQLTATAAAGSSFTGWSGGGCSGTGACNVTVNAATTVTATFAIGNYLLTVEKTGNGAGTVSSEPTGIACGGDCTQSYAYNTPVTLTAAPSAGSTFTGWSGGGCAGTGTCTVTVDVAKTVTAGFALVDNLLTVQLAGLGTGSVSSNPTGITCGADCTQSYTYGTSVQLTATATGGSSFTSWSGGGCSGTGTCTVTLGSAITVTATFTGPPVTLTVTKQGTGAGTVTSSPSGINCGTDCGETYAFGTDVDLTATPSAGSVFTGWSGACTGTGTCTLDMNAAKSAVATFTMLTDGLTVTKGGTGAGTVTSTNPPGGINCGSDCSEQYNLGTSVTLSATPATGSTFTGWSGGGCSGTGTCTVTVNAATSATATFTLNTYLLTVNKNGTGTGSVSGTGIACGGDCTETVDHGTVVALSAAPAAGSTFTGWSGGGCTGTGSCNVSMTAAQTVTATFTITTNTLTVSKAGNGAGNVTSSPGISCGSDCTETFTYGATVSLTASSSTGSIFEGWSGGGCTGTGSCTVSMNGPVTVTATFTLTSHTLTVAKNGTGTGTVTSSPGINCGSDCTQSYTYGSSVQLTASASTGSTFTGWSGGGCSGTGSCTTSMTASKTVTATFTVNSYTVTVTKAGNGSGTVGGATGINCGTDCSEAYTYNTPITLTATPATGSVFTGWSGTGGCTGTGTCTLTINAAKNVTATFTLTTHTLTVTKAGAGNGNVTSSGGGISCGTGGDCTESYDYGAVITLTATAPVGSTFAGWSGTGGCTGTGTCQLTMTAAKAATATFNVVTNALTVNKNGTGAGTVTGTGINCGGDCTETVDYGTPVALTASPAAGSTFTGWSGGGCSGNGGCTVTVNAPTTVTATFAAITYTLTVTKSGTGSGTVTGSGINCGTDCGESYNSGTPVALTATPATGSTFAGWSGACTGTGGCTVTMSQAQGVNATFNQQVFSLDTSVFGQGSGGITSSPAGIDCYTGGGDCQQTYGYGQYVTLTANAYYGSGFSGWSGAGCTGTGTCTVQMTEAKLVIAVFAIQYTLSFHGDPWGGNGAYISPPGETCTGDCYYTILGGQSVSVDAVASPGYVFNAWTGPCQGQNETCDFTMTNNATVYAYFCAEDDLCCQNPQSPGCNCNVCPPSNPDCCL